MYALLEQSNERPSAEEIAKEPDMTVKWKILVVTFQWMQNL
jgi:hypothetical protein